MDSPLQILYLEDDKFDVELVCEKLNQEGFLCEVMQVETEADFISALDDRAFHLILADYKLPSYDGLSALGVARRKCPDTPFIFLTGSMGEEFAVETLKRGATDYILKQHLSRLVPAVNRALKETRELNQLRAAEKELEGYRFHLEGLVEERTSELRAANEQLLKSEQRFEGIFLQSPIGIVIYDENGDLTDANESALKIFGIPDLPRIKGLNLFLSPTFSKEDKKKLLGGEKIFVESVYDFDQIKRLNYYHTEKSGISYLRMFITPLVAKSNFPEGFLLQVRDVTGIKKAEQALQHSEERYRRFINSSPDMIFVKDDQFRHVIVNKALLLQLGCREDEIIGKTDEDLLQPAVAERCRRTDLKAMQSDRVVMSTETWGDKVLETYKFRLRLDDNKFGIGGYIRDITDRALAEEKMKNLTDELRRSNTDLQQFAHVASHDLQAPLSVIAGFARLLTKRYKAAFDEKGAEFISQINEGVMRMQELIRDLLEYSKVGSKDLNLKRMNLSLVANKAISNLGAAIEESSATILFDQLPMITADASQIGSLFQNLIGNAIKFRGEKPLKVRISAQKNEKEWIFSVKDNGIGIESAALDRIFAVFQRLHNEEQYPGTGLGLAICKRIVERHEGRIWVNSKPGKGSTFYFTIPEKP